MVYNNLIKGAKNEKENFHDSCLCRILPFLRHGTRKGICASLQTPFLLERLFRGGGDAERLYFLHALRRENQTFHFAYSSLPEINGYNRDGFSFLGFSTGKAGGIITRRRTRSRSMNTMTSFAIMGNHPSTLAPRIISNAASLPSSAS